jgi:hypothetical protein
MRIRLINQKRSNFAVPRYLGIFAAENFGYSDIAGLYYFVVDDGVSIYSINAESLFDSDWSSNFGKYPEHMSHVIATVKTNGVPDRRRVYFACENMFSH